MTPVPEPQSRANATPVPGLNRERKSRRASKPLADRQTKPEPLLFPLPASKLTKWSNLPDFLFGHSATAVFDDNGETTS